MDLSVISNLQQLEGKPQELREEIISLRKDLGLSSIKLAFLLKTVRDNRLFTEWGYDTFESAIADPDISISHSTAYGLISIWETWVEKYGRDPEEVSEIPYDKLLIIAPIVNDQNREEMFTNAKVLSRSDLNHMKKETKANVGFEFNRVMPKVWRCKACGQWKIDMNIVDLCTTDH